MAKENVKPTQASGTAVREPPSFGRRREPATITIVRNGRSHHFAFNPMWVSIAFSLAAMFLVGYLVATAYLVFRDDLIGAAKARNARLMQQYEDRIATLRANLDRVTSRQLLDQQVIENKIAELLKREEMLRNRSGKIGELLEAAGKSGLVKQNKDAKATQNRSDTITTGSIKSTSPVQIAAASGLTLRGTLDGGNPIPGRSSEPGVPDINDIAATESLFADVGNRIEQVDAKQRAMLDTIRLAASERASKIADIMTRLRIDVPDDAQEEIGGPFIPANPKHSFASHLEAVDVSLKALDQVTGRLETVPLANPVPGRSISSRFGERMDPFVHRLAMHSGIDFRAKLGTPVHATASGTVTEAGRRGGYGNMVEIDHGGGITTRYGHLSRILVKVGDHIDAGAIIARSGNTGRSTGPHLHYEVRESGSAVNPMQFLRAGKELAKLL
jgi:murein DD-endopeptidase MepM/ murein hydrolase activator NlpD